MSTFREEVIKYEKLCEAKDIPSETVMAFLVELSNVERYNLYVNFEEEMPKDLYDKFSKGMERILNNEPMAHVLGFSWFYGYKLVSSPSALIPRVETEELCAQILARIDDYFSEGIVDCVDIGTGSGAIAITIAKEENRVKMVASDISEEALELAKINAENNEADIEFICGDMLKPFIERNNKFDILICNPPYIPVDEKMEASVVDYEPNIALFGGEDGLKFYREIFKDGPKILNEKAMMAFEMGWNQKEKMQALLNEYLPNIKYEIVKDMNGKDRMLFVYFGIKVL